MEKSRSPIVVRVATVLLRDGVNGKEVLVVEHTKYNQSYYVLPGGRVEAFESLQDATLREIKEECNLDIELGDIVYVGDFITDTHHGIDVVFSATIQGGTLTNEHDPDKQYGIITDLYWLPLETIQTVDFRPQIIAKSLLVDTANNFACARRYLGNYKGS